MEDNRLRPHQVKLRLNDEELDLLDKKVALSEARNRMDLLRHLIVYGAVFKADLSGFNEFNSILSSIDRHLNEILHEIKDTGNIYEKDVTEMRKEMKRIWQLLESILSKVPSLNP